MKKPENKETKKATDVLVINSYKILRVHQFQNGGVTFDAIINGISIYGINVVEGKNGDFISFPQRKGNDGKYYSIVWARISSADQEKILADVERMLNE